MFGKSIFRVISWDCFFIFGNNVEHFPKNDLISKQTNLERGHREFSFTLLLDEGLWFKLHI